MIRDLVLDAQAAEPAIGQVDFDLPTQGSLRADRKYVANDQHPQHQHRIGGWRSARRVGRSQLGRIEYSLRGGRMNTDFVEILIRPEYDDTIQPLIDYFRKRAKHRG